MSYMFRGISTSFRPHELESVLNGKMERADLAEKGPFRVRENHLRGMWRDKDEDMTAFILCRVDGFPSQCGMCVLHHWEEIAVDMEKFKEYWNWVEEILSALNYTKVMVTLTQGQHSIITLLEEQGLKKIDSFINKRTHNMNHILTKEIP